MCVISMCVCVWDLSAIIFSFSALCFSILCFIVFHVVYIRPSCLRSSDALAFFPSNINVFCVFYVLSKLHTNWYINIKVTFFSSFSFFTGFFYSKILTEEYCKDVFYIPIHFFLSRFRCFEKLILKNYILLPSLQFRIVGQKFANQNSARSK